MSVLKEKKYSYIFLFWTILVVVLAIYTLFVLLVLSNSARDGQTVEGRENTHVESTDDGDMAFLKGAYTIDKTVTSSKYIWKGVFVNPGMLGYSTKQAYQIWRINREYNSAVLLVTKEWVPDEGATFDWHLTEKDDVVTQLNVFHGEGGSTLTTDFFDFGIDSYAPVFTATQLTNQSYINVKYSPSQFPLPNIKFELSYAGTCSSEDSKVSLRGVNVYKSNKFLKEVLLDNPVEVSCVPNYVFYSPPSIDEFTPIDVNTWLFTLPNDAVFVADLTKSPLEFRIEFSYAPK